MFYLSKSTKRMLYADILENGLFARLSDSASEIVDPDFERFLTYFQVGNDYKKNYIGLSYARFVHRADFRSALLGCIKSKSWFFIYPLPRSILDLFPTGPKLISGLIFEVLLALWELVRSAKKLISLTKYILLYPKRQQPVRRLYFDLPGAFVGKGGRPNDEFLVWESGDKSCEAVATNDEREVISMLIDSLKLSRALFIKRIVSNGLRVALTALYGMVLRKYSSFALTSSIYELTIYLSMRAQTSGTDQQNHPKVIFNTSSMTWRPLWSYDASLAKNLGFFNYSHNFERLSCSKYYDKLPFWIEKFPFDCVRVLSRAQLKLFNCKAAFDTTPPPVRRIAATTGMGRILVINDVNPFSQNFRDKNGWELDYYSSSVMQRFIGDIIAAVVSIGVTTQIFLKRKRINQLADIDSNYNTYVDNLESEGAIRVTEHHIKSEGSIAVSIPFTTAALYYPLDQSFYYDPLGQIAEPEYMYYERPLLCSYTELGCALRRVLC